MLLPNAIAEISFTVFVDNSTAPKLNLAEKALKGTVILHSMLGKDHFISIMGEYRAFLASIRPCHHFTTLTTNRIHLFCNFSDKADSPDRSRADPQIASRLPAG